MDRNRIKKISYHLTRPISFGALRGFSNENFIFPFFHLVADKTPGYIRQLYDAPTPEQFIADLEFLLKFYEPASLDDLKKYVNNGKKTRKPLFFLSFDDGLKECYEMVYPILKERGIQAAFFINPSFVDNNAVFHRFKTSLIIDRLLDSSDPKIISNLSTTLKIQGDSKEKLIKEIWNFSAADTVKYENVGKILGVDIDSLVKNEKPYMTMEQLKSLNADGFMIGAHSMNHPMFFELSEPEQIEQFENSIQFVHDNFGQKYHSFAFPYTDDGVSSSFFDYLEKSDKVDFTFGTAGIKRDNRSKHIQRIPMEVQGFKSARQTLRSQYAYYMLKSLFGRNKIER